MIFMPDRSAGRQERGADTEPGAALFPPAGNVIEGDPVGSVSEADADAAEELFKGVYPRLAGWVRRLVDDDETAHEIASEAFTRLLARWSALDNPQSYLYMIATNLVRDHWRKMERERRAFTKAAAGTDPEPYSDPSQDVDIRELLSTLPAKLREPFLLHYYAGFGVKEIAAQLRRPEGTIKADLYHARAKLKEMLAQLATGPMPIQGGGDAASTQGGEGRGERRGIGESDAS